MSGALNRPHSNFAEALKVLESGLRRYFKDEWLFINGYSMHVDDVLEAVERHAAQIQRTHDAFATWLEEATFLRDELRAEIRPLLDGVREFLANELGEDSPRLREFGFKPTPANNESDGVGDAEDGKE